RAVPCMLAFFGRLPHGHVLRDVLPRGRARGVLTTARLADPLQEPSPGEPRLNRRAKAALMLAGSGKLANDAPERDQRTDHCLAEPAGIDAIALLLRQV